MSRDCTDASLQRISASLRPVWHGKPASAHSRDMASSRSVCGSLSARGRPASPRGDGPLAVLGGCY